MYDKILIISDIHGLIEELLNFLENIEKKHPNIAYCLQLGDFFKGRNVIGGQKTFSFWKDLAAFENLPFPIFSIKGNEDINIPDDWWSGMLSLLPTEKKFLLDELKLIPISYFEESKEFIKSKGIKRFLSIRPPKKKKNNEYFPLFNYEPLENVAKPEILTSKEEIDIIATHVPPYGLLDKTRDYTTHKEIKYTGNKFTRLVIDKRRPKVVFFGHNHFCNYKMFGNMLVVSVDKFCRKIPVWADDDFLSKKPQKSNNRKKKYSKSYSSDTKEKNMFSYCLIIRNENNYIIETYRRDRLVFQYDLNKRKILLSKL
ncbi:MAG: metallophosphoesterase [archaeon]|nr:metallophosphoesterase [archaeon]